jgi:hypothetical protein
MCSQSESIFTFYIYIIGTQKLESQMAIDRIIHSIQPQHASNMRDVNLIKSTVTQKERIFFIMTI